MTQTSFPLHLRPAASAGKIGSHALSSDRATHEVYMVHDSLRHGFADASVKGRILTSQHPLETVVEKHEQTQFETNLALQRSIYGLHAPIRLQMERALISQVQRVPGLPSSNLALDILNGNDTTLDVEDFLGGSDYAGLVDLHTAMEHKLRMNV